MHTGILIGTIILEIIIIFGISAILQWRKKATGKEKDFATTSRSMPAVAVAATQALTCLGGGHIMGMPGAASMYGISAMWYLFASGIMIVLMMCVAGPWIRRLGFSNVPDMFAKMFDRRTGILVSAFTCAMAFGVLTCETQGVGTVVSVLTGSDIVLGCVIGGIIGLCYVYFGGMEEVGWVNVFNSIIMYVGAIVIVAYLGNVNGGWDHVNQTFIDAGEQWKLQLSANPDTWRTYIIGTLVAGLFNQMVAGQSGQISASAKNVKALRNAAILAVPMNVIFGLLVIVMYMSAAGSGLYTDVAGSPGYVNMYQIVNSCPGWMAAWMMAAFAAAMLSTIAVQLLTLSTIFVQTIVIRYWKKDATKKQETRYIRIGILIVFAFGTTMATTLPEISSAMVWLFAWLLPGCWIFIFGIWWKRSKMASFWSLLLCGIFNCFWSFTSLPSVFHLEGNNNSIGMLVVSVFSYIIIAAFDKHCEPPFKQVYIQNRDACISEDLKKAEEAAAMTAAAKAN